MTAAEVEKYYQENGTSRERYHANGIDYLFIGLSDGWTAIFEICRGDYTPIIQAATLDKAKSYCNLREPVTVPLTEIC